MKRLFVLICSFIAPIATVYCQSIEYAYDDAGNRVVKEIIFEDPPDDPFLERKGAFFRDNLDSLEVKIYPNPATEMINIQLSDSDVIAELRLLDSNGKMISKKQSVKGSAQINIGKQADGLYFLVIRQGESNTQWKVLKQ